MERAIVDNKPISEGQHFNMLPKLRNIKFNLSEKYINRIIFESIRISRIKHDTYKIDVKVHGLANKGFIDVLMNPTSIYGIQISIRGIR